MDHQRIYDSIIEKAKSEDRKKKCGTYYEKHHILPKCLGGIDNKENLVLLTAKEHFVCHKLLTYIYKNNRKIACAYHKMIYGNSNKCNKSSRDYAYARELISKTPVPKETCKKISKGNKGKIRTEEHKINYKKPKSEEHKQNMRKPKSEEHKKHMFSRKGLKHSEKSKQLMSELKRGENHPQYGTHHSELWIKHFSDSKKIKIAQLDSNNNIIKIWDSAKDVQDQLKIPKSNICNVCKNNRPKAGGFKWKYHEV